jgi:hypothetical protein
MKIIIRSFTATLALLTLLGAGMAEERKKAAASTASDTSSTDTTKTDTSKTDTTKTDTTKTDTTDTTKTDTTKTDTTTTTIGAEDLFRQARELIQEASAKPTPTKIKCSWATTSCSTTDLYVNGDAISIVQISDLPRTRSGHVAVTAGETSKDPTLSVNEKDFNPLPTDISVAIHLSRGVFPTFGLFGSRRAMRDAYTVGRLERRLDLIAAARKKANETMADSRSLQADQIAALEKADLEKALNAQEDFVSLVVSGQSPLLLIRVDADGKRVTFPVVLVYQRWYFDTGGFFAFMKARDEELVTENAPDNQVKVLQRRRVGNAGTATGISFNVHPGNYPEMGLQFGLVHNNDRAPSYFLGATGRLRSIGRTALMSFSAGYAESQVKTFPGVAVNGIYPSDHALIRGQTRYTARPYLAVGVGINLSSLSQGSAATPPATGAGTQ